MLYTLKMSIKIMLMISASIILIYLISVTAEARDPDSMSFGDAWYKLEKNYPSPERRYSRKELDRARRRANNSLWMDTYGRRDPIYQSDQYWGSQSYPRRSGYIRVYPQPMYYGW